MTGEPCILVNRTPDPLRFVADSRHYVLQPGENHGFNTGHARFAMAQNPLMGSEDFYSLEFQSLVGIKGETDCTPISAEDLIASYDRVERFDRDAAQLPGKVKQIRKPRSARGVDSSSNAGQNAFAVVAEA